MTLRRVSQWVAAASTGALMACSSSSPAPEWAVSAQSASERAVKAYLRGERRVAEVEWSQAFTQVSATGQTSEMARLALLQCAAQTAALEWGDCPRFMRYASGATPAEQAYARYLRAAHHASDVAQLPRAQQLVAQQLLARQAVGDAQLAALPDAALSSLTAAAVALRAGALDASGIEQAIRLASAQGWRRAVMAWLLVAQRAAQHEGDSVRVQALELRLQILQEAGVLKK